MINKRRNEDEYEDLLFPVNPLEKSRIRSRSYNFSEHTIYLDTEIKGPEHYRDEFYLLKNASDNEEIFIEINTAGGRVDTCVQFMNMIDLTAAEVTGVIQCEAASAGSILALHCHNLLVSPRASMFIHTVQMGFLGSEHEMFSNTEHSRLWTHRFIRDAYEGFLLPQEIEAILDNKVMYLMADEILERLEKREKYFEEKNKPIEVAPKKKPVAKKKATK